MNNNHLLQVVLLGSGLDSRPWRLALPPGVAWFEVDRRDVLAAKTRRLKEMGAQTRADSRPQAALQMHSLTGAGSGAVAQQQQQQAGLQEQQGQGQRVCTHPLTARSWDCVAVDLQHRGWSRGLLRAGLDPAQPVCWILEGLLYYLEERDVRALLQVRARAAKPSLRQQLISKYVNSRGRRFYTLRVRLDAKPMSKLMQNIVCLRRRRHPFRHQEASSQPPSSKHRQRRRPPPPAQIQAQDPPPPPPRQQRRPLRRRQPRRPPSLHQAHPL